MPAAARVGDPDTGGGVVLAGAATVFVNNIPMAVIGKPVSGHGKGPHAGPSTQQGSGTVFVENIPAHYVGASDTCGHVRASGSSDTFVGT